MLDGAEVVEHVLQHLLRRPVQRVMVSAPRMVLTGYGSSPCCIGVGEFAS